MKPEWYSPITWFGGGNAITQQINDSQTIMNSITNDTNQVCQITTESSAIGNIVTIDNSIINGDAIGIENSVSVNSGCAITSTMNTSIDSILSAISQQSAAADNTGMLSGLLSNTDDITTTTNISQLFSNTINNINNAVCDVNTDVVTRGNFVFVNNSTVNGTFVGVDMSGTDVVASCNMNNTMNNIVYNQGQSSVTQSTVMKSNILEIIVVIVIAIGAVLIICGIVKAVSMKTRTAGSGGTAGTDTAGSGTTGVAQAAQAAQASNWMSSSVNDTAVQMQEMIQLGR